MLEHLDYGAPDDAEHGDLPQRSADAAAAHDDCAASEEEIDNPFAHLLAAAEALADADAHQSEQTPAYFPGEGPDDPDGLRRLEGNLMRPSAPRMCPAELDACTHIRDSAELALPVAQVRVALCSTLQCTVERLCAACSVASQRAYAHLCAFSAGVRINLVILLRWLAVVTDV